MQHVSCPDCSSSLICLHLQIAAQAAYRGCNAADVAELQLPRPCIIHCALLWVRQDLECGLDPPKCNRIATLVRVMHLCEAPKGLQRPKAVYV